MHLGLFGILLQNVIFVLVGFKVYQEQAMFQNQTDMTLDEHVL